MSDCNMKQQEPYDFAWCETHDTTFALGDKCKFDGREPVDVYFDEAQEQRGLKVRAEMDRDFAHQVLALFVDSEPCWFDHHGDCQAHGFTGLKDDGGPGECPMVLARRIIAPRPV